MYAKITYIRIKKTKLTIGKISASFVREINMHTVEIKGQNKLVVGYLF